MTKSFSLQNKRVYVAGHRGMVGRAVIHRLQDTHCALLTNDIDLREQQAVREWFAAEKPDVVVLAAARVGGIAANSECPADFIYDNLMIESNVIHTAYETGVGKLLFLGSSCIYPREAPQPISEDVLLAGPLEPTNEWYAVAKIAGIKLCQAYRRQYGCDFIAAMPCNLYGPGDTYDMRRSHVIPALIMKMHEARQKAAASVEIWGTGTPLREFLHVDDLARALVFLLEHYSEERPINVGSAQEVSIGDLAALIAQIIGYKGEVAFNPSMPDGAPRKVMDSSRLAALGWRPQIDLLQGLGQAYDDYMTRTTLSDAA